MRKASGEIVKRDKRKTFGERKTKYRDGKKTNGLECGIVHLIKADQMNFADLLSDLHIHRITGN